MAEVMNIEYYSIIWLTVWWLYIFDWWPFTSINATLYTYVKEYWTNFVTLAGSEAILDK